MSATKVVLLKGDYVGKHERQEHAKKEKCDVVVSFHLNFSTNKDASGSEVYYAGPESLELAKELLQHCVSVLGLPNRGVKWVQGTRAGFIYYYPMPAVLVEVAFLSNPLDVAKVHDPYKIEELAKRFAQTLKKYKVVGLDVGHLFKTSSPHDKGANCLKGDTEADHALTLALWTAYYLQQSV